LVFKLIEARLLSGRIPVDPVISRHDYTRFARGLPRIGAIDGALYTRGWRRSQEWHHREGAGIMVADLLSRAEGGDWIIVRLDPAGATESYYMAGCWVADQRFGKRIRGLWQRLGGARSRAQRGGLHLRNPPGVLAGVGTAWRPRRRRKRQQQQGFN
jgi:hypothetical protein